MNLQEIFLEALAEEEYDDFTKIRWIYLCVCELFSYDVRYIFADREMKGKIYHTQVDTKNVKEVEIVCYTLACVLVDILTTFGYKCEIRQATSDPLTHVYVIDEHNGYILKLDPTKRHDISRVKINNVTIDFNSVTEDDLFADKLLEADKKIAPYFGGLYLCEKSVINVAEKTLGKVSEYIKENKLSKMDAFRTKFDALCGMVNSRTDLKKYDDIDFYYSYIMRYFNINKEEIIRNGITAYRDHFYVKPVVLFNKQDKEMRDIINISCIEYEYLTMFYALKREGDHYKIGEIYQDEAYEILEQYKSPLCQDMLVTKAKKLKR